MRPYRRFPGGTPRAFDPRAHAARPHAGEIESANLLLCLLQDSPIRQSHLECGRVQDAYAIRCAPQVHGAVRDALREAFRVFSVELNSAADNPLAGEGEILPAGNFHGQALALQLDYMAIALWPLSGIPERRIAIGW